MRVERIYKEYPISIEGGWIGADIAIAVSGGARPHVGAVALSIMSPALNEPDKLTCTEQVLAVQGHKETDLARNVATRLAKKFGCSVSVTCGIHYPDATKSEIGDILTIVSELTDECSRVLLD